MRCQKKSKYYHFVGGKKTNKVSLSTLINSPGKDNNWHYFVWIMSLWCFNDLKKKKNHFPDGRFSSFLSSSSNHNYFVVCLFVFLLFFYMSKTDKKVGFFYFTLNSNIFNHMIYSFKILWLSCIFKLKIKSF